jgi:hypothetical protein
MMLRDRFGGKVIFEFLGEMGAMLRRRNIHRFQFGTVRRGRLTHGEKRFVTIGPLLLVAPDLSRAQEVTRTVELVRK